MVNAEINEKGVSCGRCGGDLLSVIENVRYDIVTWVKCPFCDTGNILTPPVNYKPMLENAIGYLDLELYDKASALFKEIVAVDDKNFYAWLGICISEYYISGEIGEHNKKRTIELCPNLLKSRLGEFDVWSKKSIDILEAEIREKESKLNWEVERFEKTKKEADNTVVNFYVFLTWLLTGVLLIDMIQMTINIVILMGVIFCILSTSFILLDIKNITKPSEILRSDKIKKLASATNQISSEITKCKDEIKRISIRNKIDYYEDILKEIEEKENSSFPVEINENINKQDEMAIKESVKRTWTYNYELFWLIANVLMCVMVIVSEKINRNNLFFEGNDINEGIYMVIWKFFLTIILAAILIMDESIPKSKKYIINFWIFNIVFVIISVIALYNDFDYFSFNEMIIYIGAVIGLVTYFLFEEDYHISNYMFLRILMALIFSIIGVLFNIFIALCMMSYPIISMLIFLLVLATINDYVIDIDAKNRRAKDFNNRFK